MAGLVRVEGAVVDKPGSPVKEAARLEVAGPAEPFVSRAGRKLAGALDAFAFDPRGLRCLDVGASTGGFTDCLLQRGAAHVTALDVGYGLIDARLRADPRVEVVERVNARLLSPDFFPRPFDLVVVDVSFISLLKVVPALLPHLAAGGALLCLIKPQFEIGREGVGKGGIVRDETARREIVDRRATEIAALGLALVGRIDSPVAGAEGNREALALFVQTSPACSSPANGGSSPMPNGRSEDA
jgi:23S rRNA (cytidine1920-2'-O)/16S rRNA (cytidine1409-2'-O)-methyltransferase